MQPWKLHFVAADTCDVQKKTKHYILSDICVVQYLMEQIFCADQRRLTLIRTCWQSVCIYKLDGECTPSVNLRQSDWDWDWTETSCFPPITLWQKWSPRLRVLHARWLPWLLAIYPRQEKSEWLTNYWLFFTRWKLPSYLYSSVTEA